MSNGRLVVRKQDSAADTIQAAAEVMGTRLFRHTFEADLCERQERAAEELPEAELAALERRRAAAALRVFHFADLRTFAERGRRELHEAVTRITHIQEQAAALAKELGGTLAKVERDLDEFRLAAQDADSLVDELDAKVTAAGGDPSDADAACLHAGDLCNPDLEVGRRAVMR